MIQRNIDALLGDLVAEAGCVQIGGIWLLDKLTLMQYLRAGEAGFERAQQVIESRLSGEWSRQCSSDARLFIYKRVA